MNRFIQYIAWSYCMITLFSCSNMSEPTDDGIIYITPSFETSVSTRAGENYVYSTPINACVVQIISKYNYSVIQQNTYHPLSNGDIERLTMYNGVYDFFKDVSFDRLYVNNGAGYYKFRAYASINSVHTFTNSAYSESVYSVETKDVPAFFLGHSYVGQSGNVSLSVKPMTSSLKVNFLGADGSNQLQYTVDSIVLVDIPVCSTNSYKIPGESRQRSNRRRW